MSRNGRAMVCVGLLKMLIVFAMMSMSWVAYAEPVEVKILEFWDDVEPNSRLKVNHSIWQSMLDKYLDDKDTAGINRFDYEAVTEEDEDALKEYVSFLQNYDPRQFNLQEQKAYWLNLYNAAVVGFVLKEKPDESIRELRSGAFSSGPWKRRIFKIATKKMSLNDVENGIMRPIIKDPRLHYALTAGTLSCPNLQKQAYTGANVEELLEQAARAYVNHKRGVSVEGSTMVLSKMYDWYQADFGDVVAHIKQYAEADLSAALANASEIEYDYNWDLNKP